MPIRLHIAPISRFMLGLAVLFIIAHIVMLSVYFAVGDADRFDFIGLIDLDAESNFPTLFAVGLLLFAALLARLLGQAEPALHIYWRLLGILLVFMAVDESLSLHEEFVGPWTDEWIESRGQVASGYLYYAWVIPYGLAVLAIGPLFVRFLLRLPRRTAIGLVCSGTLFVTGAIGMEMLAGNEVAEVDDANSLYYRVLSTLEESMEMLAIIWLCRVMMGHLATLGTHFTFTAD